MLLITSSSLLLTLSLTLILCSTPLIMGLWILLIALTTSWFIGITYTSWFAIIIFLIYVGGMLVMFAYFTALTPNQPLDMMMLPTFTILWTLIILFMLTSFHSISPNLAALYASPSHIIPTTILYSPMNSLLLLMMASILFLILIAVVKIANINNGPLRPFSYV